MIQRTRRARIILAIVALTSRTAAQTPTASQNPYDTLLHSSSLSQQRDAVAAILATPDQYIRRIQQDLRNYSKQLTKDPAAANRSVYVAALVRDRSFIPLLTPLLDEPDVISECIYACAPVFALSVYANFGGWTIPASMNSRSAPLSDVKASTKWIPRLTLEQRPLDDFVQGALLNRRQEVQGRTEGQLIEMAAAPGASYETQLLAAMALEASVSESRNRVDIYLLAMNAARKDASREYLNAVHTSAYRAEIAKRSGR